MAKLIVVVLRLLLVFIIRDTGIKADTFMKFFRQGNAKPTQPKHIMETTRHLFGHRTQSVNTMDPYLKVLLEGKEEKSMEAPRPTVTSTPKISRSQSPNSNVLNRMMLLGATNEQTGLLKPVYRNNFGAPAANFGKTTLQGNSVGKPQWEGLSAKRDQSRKINNSFSNTAKTYDAILNAVLDHTTTPKPRPRIFRNTFTTRKPRPVGFVGQRRFKTPSFRSTSSIWEDRIPTRKPRLGDIFKKFTTRTGPLQVPVNKYESFGSAVNFFTKRVPKPTAGKKKSPITGVSTHTVGYQQTSSTTSIPSDFTSVTASSSSSQPASSSTTELTTVLSTTTTYPESSTSTTSTIIPSSTTTPSVVIDTTTHGLDSLQNTTSPSTPPELFTTITEASDVVTVTNINKVNEINNMTDVTDATGITNFTDTANATGVSNITTIANTTEAMTRTSTMTPYQTSSEQSLTLSYIEAVSEISSVANETTPSTSSASTVSYTTEYITLYTTNMTESGEDSIQTTMSSTGNSSTDVTLTSFTIDNMTDNSSDVITIASSTMEVLNDTRSESEMSTTTSLPEESTTSGATSLNNTTEGTTTSVETSPLVSSPSPLVTSPGSTTCDPSSCSDFEDICMNGGTCVSKCTGLMCECPPGYHGFTCDKRDATTTTSVQTSE